MDLMANPKFREFIEQFIKLMSNTQTLSLEEARKESTAFFAPPTLVKENVEKITDITIKASDGHEIPVRIYNPTPNTPLPIFIYYHRGGWVFGSNEESEPVCRKFANHLGCIVAAVDYRLAPENQFPIPFHDCYDAFRWIAVNAAKLGGESGKIIVGGESAGGNLAAAVALQARDDGVKDITLQLLIYPIITSTIVPETYKNAADQYFITQPAMEFFWSAYLAKAEDATNSFASPDKATSLEHMPPALIVTAEHDPLCIEGEEYAKNLQGAGNFVTLMRVPGVIHGFLDLPVYDDAQIIGWMNNIRKHLDQQLEIAKLQLNDFKLPQ